MIQKTLILSDLHLGNGGDFDIFAGGHELPLLLKQMAKEPTRVILNGDTIDFLLNEDPLVLNVERAVQQAKNSVSSADTGAVLRGLGEVLAGGGEVIIRLGNHDAELALGEVQAVVRSALGQPAEIAAKLRFERGNEPHIMEVDGARVLITHGEHCDTWNRVSYHSLPGPDGPADAIPEEFTYAPGSRLVKTLMNPLKRQFGMRFADLLKPDFQGAVMTALAVHPTAVRVVFKGSTLTLMWQFFKNSHGANTFAPGDDIDHGLADAITSADLTHGEKEALMLALAGDVASSFSGDDDELTSARQKLGRTGLRLYAAAQKRVVGDTGDTYFELQPDASEWTEAQHLQEKYKVDAVVFGHTHAARFRGDANLTFINTGTWIWLMQLPSSQASDEEWAEFIGRCKRNPRLDPTKGDTVPLMTRFHGALIQPHPQGGASLSLVEWKPGQGLITHKEHRVTKAGQSS